MGKADAEPPRFPHGVETARERAYSHGAWACPSCKIGWQVYFIATDMNICWNCRYQGGDPEVYNKARSAVA